MKQKKDSRQMRIDDLQGIRISQTIKKQINHFSDSERFESRTEPSTVKLTFTQAETIDNFCKATGFSKSSVISNSIKLYFVFFDKLEKLIKYSGAVSSMLDSLP